MANMRFLYDNLIDDSTVVITEGSENADLPSSNLTHPHRTKVYRTGTSSANEWVKFDLGSAKAVQCVVILDHDLTAGDSVIKLQGNASDSWGSPSVNETITYNADVMAKFLGSPQTYQWWRVIFTKSAAGETRDIGRLFIGPYYECTKNIHFGDLDIIPIDLSVTDRSVGGQTYSEIRDIYHEIKVGFVKIGDTQMSSFKTIADAVGTHTPMFISLDPTNKPYVWLYYVKAKSLKARKVDLLIGSTYTWSGDWEFSEEL